MQKLPKESLPQVRIPPGPPSSGGMPQYRKRDCGPLAPRKKMKRMAQNPGNNDRLDFAGMATALAFALAIAFTSLFLAVLPLIHHLAVSRDFVVYWATGQQLVHHGNPYDPAAMSRIEHGTGFDGKGVYFMRNPPWALPLALPLGLLSARAAALPWSLLILALLIYSVRLLCKTLGRPASHIEWLGYCFPPALICVISGQTAIFLLLGLVLFLRLHRTHPFWAGAALWLCTLKPHLFLPFAVVLLAWIVVTRSWRTLYGAAAAILASCALTEFIDPAAFAQYMHWAGNSGIANESIPCLSVMLRNAIDPAQHWLAFVPALIACVWAPIYFWPRRHSWDWLDHGGVVMLVSLLAAPYAWLWDHALAIPALLYGASRTRSRNLVGVLALLMVALQLQPYIFSIGLNSKLFLWPAPAWLVWFLFARTSQHAEQESTVPAAAPAASLV